MSLSKDYDTELVFFHDFQISQERFDIFISLTHITNFARKWLDNRRTPNVGLHQSSIAGKGPKWLAPQAPRSLSE